MPASKADLFTFLDDLNIKTETVDHPPLRTVEESQTLRGDIPGGHTKNLFLKDKKGTLVLLVASEDADIDMKTVHKTLGCGRFSFGKPDLLMEVLGVAPGSVTPFAVINDTSKKVRVVLDAPMLEHHILNYHPLTNEATTTIGRDDLIRFLQATGHPPDIVHVSQESVSL